MCAFIQKGDNMKKEVVLLTDLISAINNLRNCPNGCSDVYDKAEILRLVESLDVKKVNLEDTYVLL